MKASLAAELLWLPQGAFCSYESCFIPYVIPAALLAALASYHPTDPSLNTATGTAAQNLLGYAGAHVSDILLQTLGLSSVLLAPIAIGWGWRLWKEHALQQPWLRLTLLPIGLLFTAITLATLRTPEAWPLAAGLGGYAGTWALHSLISAGQSAGLPMDVAIVGLVSSLIAAVTFLYVIGFSGSEWYNGARRTLSLFGQARGITHHLDRVRDAVGEFVTATGQKLATPTERIEPVLQTGAQPRHVKANLVQAEKPKPTPGKKATERQRSLKLSRPKGDSQLPSLELLEDPPATNNAGALNKESLEQNARLLIGVLEDFGVRGEIVKVRPGPVVTLYELEPAPGTKTSRVIGLSDDIARSMSAISVRIATVPGRSVIGIELPNAKRETVYLRELLASSDFEDSRAKLPLVAGKDIGGLPVIIDLARMPHLLIAGTTGSGKSVALNAMILSLLYRLSPDDCKFIMIDPKMLELSIYDDIPHLMSPVVTEPKKAVVALKWTVQEMESRYRAMSKLGVRNVEGYNKRVAEARKKGEVLTRKVQTGFDPDTGKPIIEEQPLDLSPLPLIVVVVDEMADLMMVAGKDIEGAIQRLAQMARAAGIHLIMATQRPSVDVVTGTIKANFPTRISFQVTSKVDSRTILGEQGAEQLLGQGDMLYMAGGGRVTRVHGPFVDDLEVESVVQFLKTQGEPSYIEAITDEDGEAGLDGFDEPEKNGDELYDRAVALVAREGKASTSFIQRHLQIGYNRAARIIETMEKEGVVSQANHVGKREVLVGDHSSAA